jgi:glucose/arabinose dehydrogenase
VKRYFGATGEYAFSEEEDASDSYAAFVSYGSGGLSQVGGLAFGPDGDLYVSDYGIGNMPGSVLRYHGQTGEFLEPFVTPGAFSKYGRVHPGKILFGPDGNLYVLDFQGSQILRFQGPFGAKPGSPMGKFTTISKPIAAVFGPTGYLYAASYTVKSVVVYQGPFGSSPGKLAQSAYTIKNGNPTGMAFGPDGRLYVAGSERSSLTPFELYDFGLLKRRGADFASIPAPGPFVFSSVPRATQ